MSIAQTDAPGNKPERRDFLRALYSGAPDDLYFELRCIHPTTGDVRSFWSKVGDKRTLTNVLNRGTALNCEGYGLYFAPCLRSHKQGKAEAAALLPALWVDIDCDNDAARRASALAKLNGFDQLPSAIINSGGGLHAYWFLAEPLSLDEESGQQAANILCGLFQVLGGDPQYVKSVASVMRLPGSVNTKPERSGAVVTLRELYPALRYPLSDFLWLESQPPMERIGSLHVVTLNGNGHHFLPKRTEDYLTAGAPEGSRNTELFAAACQLRDAGFSESEAEGQLATRYIADGCSEREALATIKSAYSHPPREPLPEPRQQAQEQVSDLVARYQRDETATERPTVEQVRAAVWTCAALDPLEWAQERKRLKAVCGDSFRTEDLNLMYKQACREQTRQQRAVAPDQPRYLEIEGRLVLEKPTERGIIRQTVADWSGQVIEWVTQVNDDGEAAHIMRLALRHAYHSTTLDVPSELFGDANALQRFIAQKAGGIYTVYAGMQKHLAPAILKLSGESPRRQIYRFVGWTPIEETWIYVSPELSISAQGVLSSPPEVELESRLRDYGLKEASWDNSLAAFRAVAAIFPPELAPTLLAFALLPLVQRFFPAAAPKPALHLVGTTGSGKSEIAALMSSFYGSFTRDLPPAQWGDTVNTVEALGYSLADALYWVDDYKTIYADERTFTRFLQSYSRGMGRGRLTREAKLRQERPCRGLLLSTGETTLEGEASVLARMLVLEIPPWERRDPGGKLLTQAEALRSQLSGFTAAFIQWIAVQADAGRLRNRLADSFAANVSDYQAKLSAPAGRPPSAGRVVQNWAVLLTVYSLLHEFLIEREADAVLPLWCDCLAETVRAVQQERAGWQFLDLLGQLIAGGSCVLEPLRSDPPSPELPPKTTVVGYRDERYVYLLPNVALREVEKMQPIHFTVTAISGQLKEDGILIDDSSDAHRGVQIRVRGARVRVWRLKGDCFGGDSGDIGDSRS